MGYGVEALERAFGALTIEFEDRIKTKKRELTKIRPINHGKVDLWISWTHPIARKI
jgi:hypothetical protein